jgi:DNA replication protein DnaC
MGELTSVKAMARSVRRKPVGPPPHNLYRTCPICKRTVPPQITPTGRYATNTCECEREIKRKAEAEQERREREQIFIRRTYGWLGKALTDMELATKTFDNLKPEGQPNPADRESLRRALKASRAFAENPQGNILIYGEYGLGKTHLLAAICNRLRESNIHSLFASTPMFFTAYYARIGHPEQDEWELIKQALTTPFLVIDDLDKSGEKPFRKEVFFQIIDQRTKNHLPIGISTNRMAELNLFIGQEAFSRLMIGMQAIAITGKDYRPNFIKR